MLQRMIRSNPMTVLLAAAILLMLSSVPITARAGDVVTDRHGGYYYPPISSKEVYRARAPVMDTAHREMRIGFIVAQTNGQIQRKYPPRYAIFAKGENAEKLIIIGLDEYSFATLHRARAVMAQLTAAARGSALFRNMAVEDLFTFFDLAKMLGFVQITISDGKSYAHRVSLE
ncbi:MAG: molybdopterin-guanine dinucleotide biosynthesis protein A [Alphaproteobacteria bacterium]|nr:molybdopterin-guanine dinucleotide biosynthesis protein A [Alphaproteobacteria bacterium]